MNMIDVMKRLAELDAENPNIQSEGYGPSNRTRQNINNKTYNDHMSNIKYDDGQAASRGVQQSGWRDAVGEESPEAEVYINGKPWKTFSSRDEAKRVAANVQGKYPDKKVEVFGGEISTREGVGQRGRDHGDPDTPEVWFEVKIDGKTWKSFDSKYDAERAGASIRNKYPAKKVSVVDSRTMMREGKVKELSDDLKNLSSEEFEKAHKMTKAEARKGLSGKDTVKEGTDLSECGMMAGMGSTMPASISMTAGSGPELSGMLRDIMSLAGLQKVTPDHLGAEKPMSTLTTEPPMQSGPAMRAVLDTLHMDDEGDDEFSDDEMEDEGYDNTPSDPTKPPAFDSEEFANHMNEPGAGNTMAGKSRNRVQSTATMEDTTRALFAEYKEFVAESEWTAEKPSKKFTAADKKKSDELKKSSGKVNADALKKTSKAFSKMSESAMIDDEVIARDLYYNGLDIEEIAYRMGIDTEEVIDLIGDAMNESAWTAEKPAKSMSAADKKKSDELKKSSGKVNADALKKTSDAFAKKKAD